jgi:hypothetical protein
VRRGKDVSHRRINADFWFEFVGQFQRVRGLLGALGRADQNAPLAWQMLLQPVRDLLCLFFATDSQAALVVGNCRTAFFSLGVTPENQIHIILHFF